jgi:hypothetical protein
MADAVEPIHSLLEMGMASLDEFHVTSFQLSQQGEHRAVWEARLGETNTTGSPIRWQTNRIWKAGRGGAHSQNVMTPAKDRGVSRTFGNGPLAEKFLPEHVLRRDEVLQKLSQGLGHNKGCRDRNHPRAMRVIHDPVNPLGGHV